MGKGWIDGAIARPWKRLACRDWLADANAPGLRRVSFREAVDSIDIIDAPRGRRLVRIMGLDDDVFAIGSEIP